MSTSFYEKKSQLQVNKFSDNLAGFLYPYDSCASPPLPLPLLITITKHCGIIHIKYTS